MIILRPFHPNHETLRTDDVNVLFMKYIFCILNLFKPVEQLKLFNKWIFFLGRKFINDDTIDKSIIDHYGLLGHFSSLCWALNFFTVYKREAYDPDPDSRQDRTTQEKSLFIDILIKKDINWNVSIILVCIQSILIWLKIKKI